MPGPVLGLGMKAAIDLVLTASGSPGWLERALWGGRSYLPVLWVDVVRLLPCAVAVLWPVVRLLPDELLDAARVDGARPWQELALVVWPNCARACLRAAVAVPVLSLGELSAGMLASTPGAPTFAQVVFERLHYGVTPDLAARCLLLLALVGWLGGWVVGWFGGSGTALAFRARSRNAKQPPHHLTT
jgi:ABC-type Fe3+ transport system permease subunit